MPSLRMPQALFLLPLLLLAAVWTSCRAEPAPDVSHLFDRTLTPPDPSPSPAPAQEGPDPLKDPKVRRALIRALARSLQNLGGYKIDGLHAENAPQQADMVRFHATLGTRTTASFRTAPEEVGTTTEGKQLVDNNFLSDSILEQVDKQIKKGEFLRVPPDEVLVTSKTEPRPFSLNSFGSSFEDSLSSSTVDGVNSNSLSNDEIKTTTPIPTATTSEVDELRIEQHEIKPFVPTTAQDTVLGKNVGGVGQSVSSSKSEIRVGPHGNSVDIYRAPLVAAFTLHQDYETGATRGVVPLLPVNSQSSTSSPLSFSTPQGVIQGHLPSDFPLPSDELQDLVRQIATNPVPPTSGRFTIPKQQDSQQQNFFNQQAPRLSEKQNLVYFQGPQQVISQSVQQSLELGNQQRFLPGLSQNFNSANGPVRGDFTTEQQQLQQRFQRIQTLQELHQLQARLDRLQRQVQVG